MLEKFGILVFSEYLSELEKENAVRALSDFYHSLTPKHQKRIILNWVDSPNSEDHGVFKKFDLPRKVINSVQQTEKGTAMRSSTLFLFPSARKIKKVLSNVLSCGIPVLVKENSHNKEYLDSSCGMFLMATSNERLVSEITSKVDMLYHDQEVLKLMRKGAYAQYERKFGWGLKEFRKPLF